MEAYTFGYDRGWYERLSPIEYNAHVMAQLRYIYHDIQVWPNSERNVVCSSIAKFARIHKLGRLTYLA